VFKVSIVLYERPDLDRTEALRYWREEHAPVAAKIPGLRHYVQSHAVGAPQEPPPFLGIAELVWDDEDAFVAAAASAEFAAAVADVASFGDADNLPTAFMHDVVVVD
jgi:conserved hypothetical protein